MPRPSPARKALRRDLRPTARSVPNSCALMYDRVPCSIMYVAAHRASAGDGGCLMPPTKGRFKIPDSKFRMPRGMLAPRKLSRTVKKFAPDVTETAEKGNTARTDTASTQFTIENRKSEVETRRMPAEWEPHEATWIGWPHNASDWPGKFAAIPWVYGEIARRITPGEILRVLVNSERHETRARILLRRAGVDLSRVEFFRFRTNRGWTRDFGPIFVRCEGSSGGSTSGLAIIDFRFNGWAKYPNWELDDAVPAQAAGAIGVPLAPAVVDGLPLVLEGGSIDVNGEGALLTTEECLLDRAIQPRNPQLDKRQIEHALQSYLGASQVIWLGKGIDGDDTHGHVDDVCRFAGPRTVVLCREDHPDDANYRPLEENRERLNDVRLEDGSKLEIVPLPMPSPLHFDGQRVPASYANFYIANAAVLVPTFNDAEDRIALGILAELFPERPVVGIHAVDLVWGLGTLHCLTQQQPRADMGIG
jgi:agmatine deiminase